MLAHLKRDAVERLHELLSVDAGHRQRVCRCDAVLAIVGLTHLEHGEGQLAIQSIDQLLLDAGELDCAYFGFKCHHQMAVKTLVQATFHHLVFVGEREGFADLNVAAKIRDHFGDELL